MPRGIAGGGVGGEGRRLGRRGRPAGDAWRRWDGAAEVAGEDPEASQTLQQLQHVDERRQPLAAGHAAGDGAQQHLAHPLNLLLAGCSRQRRHECDVTDGMSYCWRSDSRKKQTRGKQRRHECDVTDGMSYCWRSDSRKKTEEGKAETS